jgi:hypothetical protein
MLCLPIKYFCLDMNVYIRIYNYLHDIRQQVEVLCARDTHHPILKTKMAVHALV